MYDLMNKTETESKLKEKEMSKSALELTVLLKTGESKQFIKAFDTNKTCLTLDNLHKNCIVLQREVNDFLTTLVEQERGVSGVNNASKANGEKMIMDLSDSYFSG